MSALSTRINNLSESATIKMAKLGRELASKSWDVGVRYENYSGQSNNYGTVGLRIAYGFGL